MAEYRQPIFLENQIQHYSWGERGEQAFIPRLLGIPVKPDIPYAELWLGAHPSAPSFVRIGQTKIPLNQFIQRAPKAILGSRVWQKFDSNLPFLLKVLSAAEALSIQVHPNKEQAKRLHAQDPEHYPDPNHKPEIAIALTKFRALVGFRDFLSLLNSLKHYPEIADFIGTLAQNPPKSSNYNQKRQWVREIYIELNRKSEKNPAALKSTLQKLDMRMAGKEPATFQELVYPSLRRKYGDDVGLLSLFVLNFLELHPGEAFFIPAGVPHAYLQGTIIECMANSDNVVRAGLTPKFKDLNAMIEILTTDFSPLTVWKPESEAKGVTYQAPVEEFCVARWRFSGGEKRIFQTEDSVQMVLVLSGTLSLQWNGGKSVTIQKGNSLLLPAALDNFQLRAKEESLVFTVYVPRK